VGWARPACDRWGGGGVGPAGPGRLVTVGGGSRAGWASRAHGPSCQGAGRVGPAVFVSCWAGTMG
jgi:hypothetical protein